MVQRRGPAIFDRRRRVSRSRTPSIVGYLGRTPQQLDTRGGTEDISAAMTRDLPQIRPMVDQMSADFLEAIDPAKADFDTMPISSSIMPYTLPLRPTALRDEAMTRSVPA